MMTNEEYPRPRKRETIMQQRLRKARGEDIADDLDEEEEEEDLLSPHPVGPGGYPYPAYPYPPPYDYRFVEQRKGMGCFSIIISSILLGAVVVLFLMFFLNTSFSQIGTFISHIMPSIPGLNQSLPMTMNRSALVIEQVRQLNRIETTSYQMQTVIEASIGGNAFQNLLFGDRILLMAHGTIVAGMDLSTLGPDDVIIDGNRNITVHAPPPQIFSVYLDNEQTRVYDRKQGWLASSDKDLETRARQQAQQEIVHEACENGLMQRATDDGKRVLEQMLHLLEFDTVEVISAPIPACPN